jgi:hypothetical protein
LIFKLINICFQIIAELSDKIVKRIYDNKSQDFNKNKFNSNRIEVNDNESNEDMSDSDDNDSELNHYSELLNWFEFFTKFIKNN